MTLANTEFKLSFTSPSIEELARHRKEWLRVYPAGIL